MSSRKLVRELEKQKEINEQLKREVRQLKNARECTQKYISELEKIMNTCDKCETKRIYENILKCNKLGLEYY